MAPDRWVVVDDTDPSIKYTGSWIQEFSNNLDNIGMSGPSYLNTLHGASNAGAAVEFEFNGSAVTVLGTSVVQASDDTLTFLCFVDNTPILGSTTLQGLNTNNVGFCGRFGLSNALHTLRIEVKAPSKDPIFWLDQLRYVPIPDLPLDNKTIIFENTDPAIRFDSHWTDYGTIANMTTRKNSTTQVDFIGTSISWVAYIPIKTSSSLGAGAGTWRLDDGESTPFSFQGSDRENLLNQIYFTTPDIEAGPHTLTVAFLGDNRTTPLILDYLYVKNGTFSLPILTNNTAAPRSTVSTPRDDNHGGSSSRRNIQIIVGGVLGGIAFIIITVGVILFCWRRRKTRQKGGSINMESSGHSVFLNPNQDQSNRRTHVRKPPLHPTPGDDSAPGEIPPSTNPTLPSQQQSGATTKQRETVSRRNMTVRDAHDEVGRAGRSDEPPPPQPPMQPDGAATTDTNLVHQHEDSGLRLGAQPVTDIPPQYTPY